jgi:hypothetical protein
MVSQEGRGSFTSDEVERLHAEGFGHEPYGDDWWRANRHSLGWVCARDDDVLVGWVNVAWDGGEHAFVAARRLRAAPAHLLPAGVRVRADRRQPDRAVTS